MFTLYPNDSPLTRQSAHSDVLDVRYKMEPTPHRLVRAASDLWCSLPRTHQGAYRPKPVGRVSTGTHHLPLVPGMSIILPIEYVLIKKLLACMQYLYWTLYVPVPKLRCAEGQLEWDLCWFFFLNWDLRFQPIGFGWGLCRQQREILLRM